MPDQRAAGPVINDDLPGQCLREFDRTDARHIVGRTVWRLRHDQAYGAVGVWGIALSVRPVAMLSVHRATDRDGFIRVILCGGQAKCQCTAHKIERAARLPELPLP